MDKRTKTCQNCGGMMVVRLGEFQCTACPNIDPLEAPQDAAKPGTLSDRVWEAVRHPKEAQGKHLISAPDDWSRPAGSTS
jgi:hypothetical protein